MPKGKKKKHGNASKCKNKHKTQKASSGKHALNDKFEDNGNFKFIDDFIWSENVTIDELTKCNVSSKHAIKSRSRIGTNYKNYKKKNRMVVIKKIMDKNHPAFGQHGLFSNKKIAPNTHIIDYIGFVEIDKFESKTSDYIIHFVDTLSCDAENTGNEARFINDYRNINDDGPNVKFLNYKNKQNCLRLGVFSGSKPIKKNQELLVSYGKGFWKARINLDCNNNDGQNVSDDCKQSNHAN